MAPQRCPQSLEHMNYEFIRKKDIEDVINVRDLEMGN